MDLARALSRVAELLKDQPSASDLPSLDQAMAAAQSDLRQPAVVWPRQRWITAFPQQRGLLGSLPDRLSRRDVREACAACPETPRGAVDAFITTMAWGYGSVGYGVHRTGEILRSAGAEGGRRLASARRAVIEESPLAGYERLAGPSRLGGLGPAFGTKFLFFHNEEALILDRLMADWFRALAGVDLKPTTWRPQLYGAYLSQMRRWADDAAVPPGRLEESVFTEISAGRQSQWDPAGA